MKTDIDSFAEDFWDWCQIRTVHCRNSVVVSPGVLVCKFNRYKSNFSGHEEKTKTTLWGTFSTLILMEMVNVWKIRTRNVND